MPWSPGELQILAPTLADHQRLRATLGTPLREADASPFMLRYGLVDRDAAHALMDRVRAPGLHDGRLRITLHVIPNPDTGTGETGS